DRARAAAATSSRFLGAAPVISESISRLALSATSSIARSNAASFALDGLLNPLSLRTNCSDAARISSSVAGGSKLNSVLMFRHIQQPHATTKSRRHEENFQVVCSPSCFRVFVVAFLFPAYRVSLRYLMRCG